LFWWCFSHIQKFCYCLVICRWIFVPFTAPSLLFVIMSVDAISLLHCFPRSVLLWRGFLKKVLSLALWTQATFCKTYDSLIAGCFIFKITHVVAQGPSHILFACGTCNDASYSCFLVALLKRFINHAKSNWSIAKKHYKFFNVSAIGIRTVSHWS